MNFFHYFILAPKQTDCIRRSYTKAADAYGCLGILRLPYGEESNFIN